MAQAKALCGLSAAVTLAVIVGAYALWDGARMDAQEAETVSYQETHVYVYGLGEPAVLDSAQDDEGEPYGWRAGFSYDGVMKATLKEFELLPLDEGLAAGRVDQSSLAFVADLVEQGVAQDPALAMATLEIENVNAVSPYEDQAFFISNYSLAQDLLGEPVLFDGSIADADDPYDRRGYQFILGFGESRTFSVGWIVDRSQLSDGASLWVGNNQIPKYLFVVDPSHIKGGVA